MVRAGDLLAALSKGDTINPSVLRTTLESLIGEIEALCRQRDSLQEANNHEVERRRTAEGKLANAMDPTQRAIRFGVSPELDVTKAERALLAILAEYRTTSEMWPPFNSYHEGNGVFQEEAHELKLEVYRRHTDPRKVWHEAKQAAAMALRIMAELGVPEDEPTV
jgi:hypothetical protein